MIWLVLSLITAADQPRLLVSARVSTGFPDLLGASVTVHAIPYVDVEAGGALLSLSWLVRAGPRYMLVDAREGTDVGLSVRVAALFGYKRVDRASDVTRGFHFAGTVDLTWWLASHFGLTLQFAGGGTFDPTRSNRRVLPDLRVSFGVSL